MTTTHKVEETDMAQDSNINGTSNINAAETKAKLALLRTQLPQAVMERRDVADGLLTSLLSGSHILLLGLPGTAKSLLIRLVCKALTGASWFQWLLTKFSTPEELFGPYDLQGLKVGSYERITTGKLPEAHVAFCDEIFKANSAILNSLLTIMEERLFHNGTSATPTPLLTMVGASNELPEDESLAALHDRFLLRFWTDYIQDDTNFIALLDPSFEAGPQVTATLTLEELAWLQEEVRTVTITRSQLETMATLRRDLARDGVVASDRRWKAAVRAIQATALLNGRDHVTPSDLMVLSNILWETREEMAKVRDVVGQAADPILSDALGLLDDAKATLREVNDQAPQDSSDLDARLTFVKTITEATGSLTASTRDVMATLASNGLTMDTASQEVQEAMSGAARVRAEMEEMAMAYMTGSINGSGVAR